MTKQLLVPLVIASAISLAGCQSQYGATAPTLTTDTTAPTVPSTAPVTSSMPAGAPSDNIYKTEQSAAKGAYLGDFSDRALYVFDKDTKGVSTCTGACATTWPAYTSGATAQKTFPANITVITNPDGTKQFAWKGRPLYYYAGDNQTGDVNGDGIGGIWHLAKP